VTHRCIGSRSEGAADGALHAAVRGFACSAVALLRPAKVPDLISVCFSLEESPNDAEGYGVIVQRPVVCPILLHLSSPCTSDVFAASSRAGQRKTDDTERYPTVFLRRSAAVVLVALRRVYECRFVNGGCKSLWVTAIIARTRSMCGLAGINEPQSESERSFMNLLKFSPFLSTDCALCW
jgi:hypothetical protein